MFGRPGAEREGAPRHPAGSVPPRTFNASGGDAAGRGRFMYMPTPVGVVYKIDGPPARAAASSEDGKSGPEKIDASPRRRCGGNL